MIDDWFTIAIRNSLQFLWGSTCMMHLPPTALRGLTSLTSFVAFRQWESGGGDDWQGCFMIADTLKHSTWRSTNLVRRFAGKINELCRTFQQATFDHWRRTIDIINYFIMVPSFTPGFGACIFNWHFVKPPKLEDGTLLAVELGRRWYLVRCSMWTAATAKSPGKRFTAPRVMMLRTTRRRCQFVAWNSLKFHDWLGTAGIGPLLWWFPFGPSSRARIGRQKPPVFGMPGDHEQYIQNLSITADVLLMHLQSQPHPSSYSSPDPKVGTPVTMFASICVHTYTNQMLQDFNVCLRRRDQETTFFPAVFLSSGCCRRRWETAPVNGAISKKEQLWSLETWDKSLALGMLLQGSYFILNVFFHCVLISFSIHHMRSWSPLTIWYNLMLFRESGSTSARTELYLPSCILQFCLRGAIQLNSHAMMVPRRFGSRLKWRFVSHNLKCS